MELSSGSLREELVMVEWKQGSIRYNEGRGGITVKIEIWADFSCPFCYIGKTILDEALLQLGVSDQVSLIYKAYLLDPKAPLIARQSARDALAQKYGVSAEEAQGMLDHVSQRANDHGLLLNYTSVQTTSTLSAHRLMAGIGVSKHAYLAAALYAAYFSHGKNLADPLTLVEIAATVGIDRAEVMQALSDPNTLQKVEGDLAQAHAMGLRGVPLMVLDKHHRISGAQPLPVVVDTLKKAFLTNLTRKNG
jgi:predicted DsbA family dithiol-disulfide isomerase